MWPTPSAAPWPWRTTPSPGPRRTSTSTSSSRPGETGSVDLFFSLDEAYEEIRSRVRRFPFGPEPQVELPFLSAEDLVVFKLSFGRPKDWVDLESMLDTNPALDRAYIERKLVEIRGPTMRPRLARFRRMARRRTG